MAVRSPRAVVNITFALIGGVTAGFVAPTLLQTIYEEVRRYQAGIQIAQGGLTPAQIETLRQSVSQTDMYAGARSLPTVAAMAVLGAILGGVVGNLAQRFIERMLDRWDKMDSGDKVTLFLGIFAGIVASLPFLFLFNPLGGLFAPIATLALTFGFSALAVYALRSMEEILPWQRQHGKSRRSGIKILDTNVVIDGRIYDVMRTGFLEGQLYVPNFVLEELQFIADSSDPLRRQRGRRGLEVLRLLQADHPLEIGTQDRHAPDVTEEVDARLVRLAKALGADIVTNDFNLNRVAALQDVQVLNLNDLSLALRPNVLPRETLDLVLIREGNQPGQGVGYLEDGTMVVIENGRARLGEQVHVMVTQVIQTERGKMIFGEITDQPDHERGTQPHGQEGSYRRKRPAR